MTQLYYLIDKESSFYFFENYKDAKAKRDDFAKQYGMKMLKYGNGDMFEIFPVDIQFKTLKKYYGTLYLCRNDGAYVIVSHYKDAKHQKEYGYTIDKIVLTPYDEWCERNGIVKHNWSSIKR